MLAQTFELILISPAEEYPQETQWVNQLFANGLGTFHLRKWGWTTAHLVEYLQEVEAQYHSRIMVHYQQEVLNEVGVKGIHYKYLSLPLQKPAYQLSCGVHSWQEFQEVEERVDYAFISPFFDSISKEGYKANNQLMPIPPEAEKRKAVALGGISAENLKEIKSLGLRGAAVLGAVWNSANPVEAFLELKHLLVD